MRNTTIKSSAKITLEDIHAFNINTMQYGVLIGAQTNPDLYSLKINNEYIDVSMNSVLFAIKLNSEQLTNLTKITDKIDLAYGNKIIFKYNNINFDLYIRREGESFFGTRCQETKTNRKLFIEFLIHGFDHELFYKINTATQDTTATYLFPEHKYNYK